MKLTERNKRNQICTMLSPDVKKWLKAVFLLTAVLAAALVLSSCEGDNSAAVNEEVAATVNGEEIYREKFEQALEQEKKQYLAQGIDLESPDAGDMAGELEEQVLYNYFIYPLLIEQKAREEGITVSEDKIDERYREYTAAFGGEEEFLEEIEASGMEQEDIYDDITRELMIENYLDRYLATYLEENPSEKITEEKVSVPEEELRDTYEQLRAEYLELQEILESEDPEMPRDQIEAYYSQMEEEFGDLLAENDFEDAREKLEDILLSQRLEQMKREQEQTIIMEHIEELEEESTIEKNI